MIPQKIVPLFRQASAPPASPPPQAPKLLDQVRDKVRVKHYSLRTEQTYVHWVRRFILFHHKQHPKDMGAPEVEAFLTHLAVVGNVAASTQNQARSALLFLYKEVLDQSLPWMDGIIVAKRPQRLPVVLTTTEVKTILKRLRDTPWLMASLLYGTGMRLMEMMRLRVKDLDFERVEALIRDGKGFKDRVTMLPAMLIEPLQNHLVRVKNLHEDDLRLGYGAVYLPNALERKYPNANREWGWQYVFPSRQLSVDPRSGITRRHHADEKAMNGAAFMDKCQNVTGQLWKATPAGNGYFKLTTQFRESKDECLEGNQVKGSMNGAAFMDKCQNVTGQLWKAIPAGNGYFKLTTQFRESKDECLEGNQVKGSMNGAAFMDKCQNVTGQLWKFK